MKYVLSDSVFWPLIWGGGDDAQRAVETDRVGLCWGSEQCPQPWERLLLVLPVRRLRLGLVKGAARGPRLSVGVAVIQIQGQSLSCQSLMLIRSVKNPNVTYPQLRRYKKICKYMSASVTWWCDYVKIHVFQTLFSISVYDLPQRPNDIQLFYGNMRKIILSVIGEFRDSVSNREFLPPSSRPSLESKR